MTTIDGKSAFPEDHALALGLGRRRLHRARAPYSCTNADLILAIGCGLTRHNIATPIIAARQERSSTPPTTRATCTRPTQPMSAILGDAKLVLAQLIEAVKDRLGGKRARTRSPQEIAGEARGLARALASQAALGRAADQPVLRDVGVHARDRSGRRDRHARFRQPARSAAAVLSGDTAARLYRLGQVAPARHRARPGDRRQGRARPTSSASTSWATPRSA